MVIEMLSQGWDRIHVLQAYAPNADQLVEEAPRMTETL